MNKEQVCKILKVFIVATLIMLIFEAIFSIKLIIYLILWAIMFAQVTILNIPAYSILSISISIGLDVFGWEYLLTVISAYMIGCILAYWLGRWFGVRAVKWCAGSEEDFNKWSGFINRKGQLWYFLTILLPVFPDDLLCIVAGSIKFKFGNYCIYNLIGRTIGLITMLGTLKLIGIVGGDFPFMVIVWGIVLIIEIISLMILKKRCHN